jgi:hypothetical protein
MPNQDEAKTIYNAIKKNGKLYDRLNEEGKKAYWQYSADRKLVSIDKLNDAGKAEYQKYVNPSQPQYAMQASIVEKPQQYIQTQNEKIMSAVTPQGIKNMISQSPEQIATKRVETPKVLTTADKRRLLNERNLGKYDPQEKVQTTGKAGLAKVPTASNRMIPVGKAGIIKTQARDFNGIDAALLGALDTTTFGALNIKNDAAIKANKGAFTAGQVAGYIAPGAALTNTAGKGLAKLGAGKLLQNLGGSAIAGATIDTGQGLVAGDTGKELAKRVGRGALIGLAADGALMGIGKAGQAILKKFSIPKDLEIEIKRNVGAFTIDSEGNVYSSIDKDGNILNTPRLIRKLNKGGGGDSVADSAYVDTYGNVRKTPTTDLQLEAPKQNLPKIDEFKTMTKTVGKPEKTILVGKPVENTINKVSTKKIKLTPEETQLDVMVKRSGTNIDELIDEAEKTVKGLEEQQFQYLKNNKAKGVQSANIIRDDIGTVTGRFGKVSNNDRWYREFYAENKRPPTNAELREMAKKHLLEGFGADTMDIPANEEYVQAVKDLESYRNIKSANSSIQSVPLTITQKGIQPTPQLIPSTLKQKGRTLTTDKPIQSALNARLNKPQIAPTKNIDAPFRLTPAEKARIEGVKPPIANQGTLTSPLAQKSILEPPVKPQGTLDKPSKLKTNLGKFYSATVNNTQATANVSKKAEIMSNVARNSGATVDTIIKKGLVNMEGKKIEGKAIADIFNMPEKEAQALEDLLFETHNIDRVKQGKELTSRTTEESKLIIDNIKKQYPHLEAKAKEVNTLLKNMLDEWGVKSGLVDADLRNLVQGMYKNYVPGYRELAGVDATSFKSRGMGAAKIINKAIGGDDKLMSLQKSIPMLINKTVKAARKNELYYEILKSAEKGSPYAKILEPAGKIEEVVQKNATDKMIEAIKADGIDALTNITDSALTADSKLGYLLTVMDKGKPVKLQISEDLFKSLQALNGKGDDDLQAALKLFKAKVTNPFKSLITGYNPLFAIRNVARDIPTAYIQGTENNPFRFAKNLGSAAKDMFKNAEGFQEYKALGGEGGNYFNVEKGIKTEGKLEKVLKPLGKINNFTETLPRYAEYKGTLKREGTDYGTKMKALHNAQEVTVNFGKHGDVVKAIDAVVPYLNPAVQGLDKTRRTFMKPEAWAKALGVITVPTAAIYAINQVVDKKGYDQLDNRTKDTNFVFPMGNGTFVKIPKTRESGAVFGALFERVLRQAEKQPEAFKGYGSTIKTNFLIQNPWTDNIASPLVSGIGYNKDFAGRNVVPQYMLNDKRSPKLQYDERTSEIAKEIGDKFNLSPKQVDYIIKSYTGIVGSILIPATTKGGNVVESAVTRPFTADAAYNNEITNNFYDKLDKLKQAATDKNITQKLSSKLVTPEEQMSNLYASMTRHISDIRDGISQLGATNEARAKQQKLLDMLTELNKPIDYNQANRLKTQLIVMAREYKK